MDMVDYFYKMVIYMMENSKKEKSLEKVYIFGVINNNIKEILSTVLNMEKENINGLMDMNMRENIIME